jgi:hypothetical protein
MLDRDLKFQQLCKKLHYRPNFLIERIYAPEQSNIIPQCSDNWPCPHAPGMHHAVIDTITYQTVRSMTHHNAPAVYAFETFRRAKSCSSCAKLVLQNALLSQQEHYIGAR